MSKRKTHEEYVKEVALKNKNIEVVGKYSEANKKITHRCLIDGYEWDVTPHNVLRGRGCPKCSNHIKRTNESYVKEVKSINPNIEVLEKYINNTTPILHKCIIHNIEWNAYPNNILRGCGCKQCANELLSKNKRISIDEYRYKLKQISSTIIVIGDNYINAHTPILHKCLIDGYEWLAKPNNILSGKGCPKCNENKGERKIRLWLDNHNIIYETQKSFSNCRDIRPLPFDFYLPNKRTAIEFDGEQHYKAIDHFGGIKAFEIRQKHDNIKNEYCKNNGISLLRIPYYKNVEEELNNFLFI